MVSVYTEGNSSQHAYELKQLCSFFFKVFRYIIIDIKG